MANLVDLLSRIPIWNLTQLESSLLPIRRTAVGKALAFPYRLSKFCLFLPLCVATSSLHFFCRRLFPFGRTKSPLAAFSENPVWVDGQVGIPVGARGPIAMGFSTSDIQDSGPGCAQFEGSNWGDFYRKHREKIGSLQALPNTIENPDKLIAELKLLGMSHWRTSVNLMPKLGAEINRATLKTYCDFLQRMRDGGIEVIITLNHFVHPNDFDWKNPDSIFRMASFADGIIDDLYRAGIRKIVVTNEQAVFAFMSHIMGRFPPHRKMDITGAAVVMENQMRAQLETYQRLKKKYPDLAIGLSHDPIRYHHYHLANPLFTPLEKILCHYLTEIMHGSVLRFLKTGKFSLKVPFFTKHTFEIPEFGDAKTRPLDFLGVQYYADPLIHIYRGSVCRDREEKLTTYNYRPHPQGIASCLEECASLGIPIEITEVGVDTGINMAGDEQRIDYFNKIFQSVQKAIDCGVDIRSIYFWTKGKSWEWSEGMRVDFSFSDEKGPRGCAEWLSGLYRTDS